MGEPTKLTKKQKKGQAFRERKGKGRAKPGDDFDEDNAVPVAEDQDRAAIPAVESPEVDEPKEDGPPAVVQKPKGEKRKREDGAEEAGVKTKKKRGDGESVPSGAQDKDVGAPEAVEEVKKVSKEGMKQRFILFIGNLKYTTSAEAVRNHFKECVPPPTVRLRTPKPSETSRPTAKSKGFAFLEFDNKGALQTALKLHHSQLEGRNINVELTAGGGGKSETRLAKVKTRNKELHEQRVKKLQKQQPRNSASKEEAESDLQPQRYSTTSGFDQTPKVKRTWTIGSTLEENTKQKKRGNKKPPRSHGTGVNAIPVS